VVERATRRKLARHVRKKKVRHLVEVVAKDLWPKKHQEKIQSDRQQVNKETSAIATPETRRPPRGSRKLTVRVGRGYRLAMWAELWPARAKCQKSLRGYSRLRWNLKADRCRCNRRIPNSVFRIPFGTTL